VGIQNLIGENTTCLMYISPRSMTMQQLRLFDQIPVKTHIRKDQNNTVMTAVHVFFYTSFLQYTNWSFKSSFLL